MLLPWVILICTFVIGLREMLRWPSASASARPTLHYLAGVACGLALGMCAYPALSLRETPAGQLAAPALIFALFSLSWLLRSIARDRTATADGDLPGARADA